MKIRTAFAIALLAAAPAAAQTVANCNTIGPNTTCLTIGGAAPAPAEPVATVAPYNYAGGLNMPRPAPLVPPRVLVAPIVPTATDSRLAESAARRVGELIRAGQCGEAVGLADATRVTGLIIVANAACGR